MAEMSSTAPAAQTYTRRAVVAPLRSFLRTESGSAGVLVLAIVAALVWANVDSGSYEAVWRMELSIRLGDPPTPVPEPFASMLTGLAASRANMNTAANPACAWLFPGGRAGQPLTPGALLQQLRALGVPAAQARTSAFRQLVLQAPAPVAARALGYSPGTATEHVLAAGGTWSRYPARRSDR